MYYDEETHWNSLDRLESEDSSVEVDESNVWKFREITDLSTWLAGATMMGTTMGVKFFLGSVITSFVLRSKFIRGGLKFSVLNRDFRMGYDDPEVESSYIHDLFGSRAFLHREVSSERNWWRKKRMNRYTLVTDLPGRYNVVEYRLEGESISSSRGLEKVAPLDGKESRLGFHSVEYNDAPVIGMDIECEPFTDRKPSTQSVFFRWPISVELSQDF